MKKALYLPFIMIFLFCGTSLADVITTFDGSVFEGELTRKDKEDDTMVFATTDGKVAMWYGDVVAIEDRVLTIDERAKLLKFKTEDYDVTLGYAYTTPLEERVTEEVDVLAEQDRDMSYKTRVRLVGEQFNLPPIIVSTIFYKVTYMEVF